MDLNWQIYYDTIIKSPLFSGFDKKTVEESCLLLKSMIKSFRKGDSICSPGLPFFRFGLVLKGRVQVCLDGTDGNRILMAEVSPGNTFGDSLSYLKIQDPQVWVLAAEDSDVMWLSPECLINPSYDLLSLELIRRFAGLLAQRTLQMNNRIQILSKLTIREKLLMFFQEQSKGVPCSEFIVSMNREELAAYIGTNRSALSRELSQMSREGIIRFSGHRFQLMK